MLRYKGGSSVANILVPSAQEHRDAQGKGTYARKGHSGKILQGPKVSRRRGKVLQGLRIRHASDGGGFSYLESLKNVKGDSIGVPFSKVI
jgi:hypothetical protein